MEELKKKVDLDLILGILLLSFGLISTTYAIVTVIIKLIFGYMGIIIYVKDLLFDLVFILLGLLIIRKKKDKNFHHQQIR